MDKYNSTQTIKVSQQEQKDATIMIAHQLAFYFLSGSQKQIVK